MVTECESRLSPWAGAGRGAAGPRPHGQGPPSGQSARHRPLPLRPPARLRRILRRLSLSLSANRLLHWPGPMGGEGRQRDRTTVPLRRPRTPGIRPRPPEAPPASASVGVVQLQLKLLSSSPSRGEVWRGVESLSSLVRSARRPGRKRPPRSSTPPHLCSQARREAHLAVSVTQLPEAPRAPLLLAQPRLLLGGGQPQTHPGAYVPFPIPQGRFPAQPSAPHLLRR